LTNTRSSNPIPRSSIVIVRSVGRVLVLVLALALGAFVLAFGALGALGALVLGAGFVLVLA